MEKEGSNKRERREKKNKLNNFRMSKDKRIIFVENPECEHNNKYGECPVGC